MATNYHILNENYIEKNKNIEVTLNDDNKKKIIQIEKSRIIFSDENLDITFIQIKPKKDNIKHFLEISEDLMKKDNNILESKYRKKSIYIMHYPKGKNIKVSYGLIKNIEKDKINHFCNTDNGSSGSPVLYLDNFKIIGIHCGYYLNQKLNKSSFMKAVLKKFNQFINNNNDKIYYNNNQINLNNNQINLNNNENNINQNQKYLNNNNYNNKKPNTNNFENIQNKSNKKK